VPAARLSFRWRPGRHDECVRVLVVEDEQRMAAAIARGLVAEGFAVDVAHDGARGAQLAELGGHDVIVCDVMLPRLSGYELVRGLRRAGVWTPVLLLTAKDGEYDEADGLDLGADDYLTKPFSFVVLVARLRALLRRGAPERPAVLVAGLLELDPGGRRVTRDGEPVELTAREFALLEYLMRSAGRVVSKAELVEHVWDSPDTDPNAVEVYVGYLRRKLGADALQTHRGAGYRIPASRTAAEAGRDRPASER